MTVTAGGSGRADRLLGRVSGYAYHGLSLDRGTSYGAAYGEGYRCGLTGRRCWPTRVSLPGTS